MTGRLVLVGGGGHATVLAEVMRLSGMSAVGYIAMKRSEAGPGGLEYLGTEQWLEGNGAGVELINGVGTVVPGGARREVFERLRDRGFRFVTLVHPAARVAEGVKLGEGAQVMAGAVVQPEARIGANALVNTGVIVDHHSRVGAHVHLATGVVLAGDVRIGDSTFVGAGATIIHGLEIGDRVLVAAGAVVVGDVPDGTRVYGVPAQPRKSTS